MSALSDKSISKFSQANLSSHSAAASQSSSQALDNHHDIKPNYVVKEVSKEGETYFVCQLYFPKGVKDIILRKQNPEKACVKKRDAENHVALQAVKRL